jgi:hypothetical protein
MNRINTPMRKTLSITAKLPDGEGGGGKVNPGLGRSAQSGEAGRGPGVWKGGDEGGGGKQIADIAQNPLENFLTSKDK